MTTLIDLLLERKTQNAKYFKKPYYFAKIIKKEATKTLTNPKVYLFGSIVEEKAIPSSDIDLLITSKNMPEIQEERAKIKAKLWKKIGLYSPFEIHMVNESEFQWYKHFAKLVEI